jgi:hypothetical protein
MKFQIKNKNSTEVLTHVANNLLTIRRNSIHPDVFDEGDISSLLYQQFRTGVLIKLPYEEPPKPKSKPKKAEIDTEVNHDV